MSAAAAWSYTATATWWQRQSRDQWSGAATFGPPATIQCDYSGKQRSMRDARGHEYTSSLTIYTELSQIRVGDRIALGEHIDGPGAESLEVRDVLRHADTLDRDTDDFEIVLSRPGA